MNKILTVILVLFQTLCSAQDQPLLRTYAADSLRADFDLMVGALKEAHAGLYWYNTSSGYDSIAQAEREKLVDGMDAYAFFRAASKMVTATREGHCRVGSSRAVGEYFNTKAQLPPLLVKMLHGNVYLLNDVHNQNTSGKILRKINDQPIAEIIDQIFLYSPKFADGYITTGKIRYSVDYAALAYNYTDFFENTAIYALELLDTATNIAATIHVPSVTASQFRKMERQLAFHNFQRPIELKINETKDVAQLSLHSFKHTNFDKNGMEDWAFAIFKAQIDSVFSMIKTSNVKNLIIDLRNNGGGTEGYEDYVFSYLTDKPYKKYRYVQANATTFSFLDHTQHNTAAKKREFEKDMANEFDADGKGNYYRRADFTAVDAAKESPFKGNLYVLVSGRTYSGGAEFASLLKAYTAAIFVGEETGGGFYGQTSGFQLALTLPNTKTKIYIPLLKFVTAFSSKDIPEGRGVIPDHQIQPTYEEFTDGVDAELNYSLKLIEKL